MEQPTQQGRDASTVTLSIAYRVRPGLEGEFEGFLRGIDHAASRFPGYLGARVFRPSRGDRQYRVVLRFDRESNLRRWEESEERRAWSACGESSPKTRPASRTSLGLRRSGPSPWH